MMFQPQSPKGYIAQICEVRTPAGCSMETVQQNDRFTLFSSKYHSNIYSILFGAISWVLSEIFRGGDP